MQAKAIFACNIERKTLIVISATLKTWSRFLFFGSIIATACADEKIQPSDINREYSPDEFTVVLWHLDDFYDGLKDASGNENNGNTMGEYTPSWIQDKKFGNLALLFEKDTLYITPSKSTESIKTAFTLEAWLKPADIQKRGVIIGKNMGKGKDDCFGLYIEGGMLKFRINYIDKNGKIKTSLIQAGIKQDIWQHLAGTVNGADMKLYINGLSAAETRLEDFSQLNYRPDIPITIGSFPAPGLGGWLNGVIDEIRVSNTAREYKQAITGTAK